MFRLISFEGGDGSGKTTQLRLLEKYLVSRGEVCLCTREPGGTTLGEMIRQVLLTGDVRGEAKGDPSPLTPYAICPPTEIFLYLADRAQHVHEVIRPALASGRLVLCDRFTDSTLAYQGYGRGVDLDMLRRLNQVASHGIMPDLTFLLDCPVEVGLSRTAQRLVSQESGKGREDRFEREKAEFHERVRTGFLKLAQAEPERIYLLDASRPIQEIHEEIRRIVDAKLNC